MTDRYLSITWSRSHYWKFLDSQRDWLGFWFRVYQKWRISAEVGWNLGFRYTGKLAVTPSGKDHVSLADQFEGHACDERRRVGTNRLLCGELLLTACRSILPPFYLVHTIRFYIRVEDLSEWCYSKIKSAVNKNRKSETDYTILNRNIKDRYWNNATMH